MSTKAKKKKPDAYVIKAVQLTGRVAMSANGVVAIVARERWTPSEAGAFLAQVSMMGELVDCLEAVAVSRSLKLARRANRMLVKFAQCQAKP